jgi:hypothetical protein
MGELNSGGVSEFELFLLILSLSELFLLFLFICHFSCLWLVLWLFLLLDDPLEFFLPFWSSSCASWGFVFELQNLCFCYQ